MLLIILYKFLYNIILKREQNLLKIEYFLCLDLI